MKYDNVKVAVEQSAPCFSSPYITHGEPFNQDSGWYNRVITLIPVYLHLGDKKVMLDCIRKDTGSSYDEKGHRITIAKYIWQLRRNGYKWYTRYAKYDDPMEFIKWVKENSYTFHIMGRSLLSFENGEWQFHGNLREYSAAFCFYILDEELAKTIHDTICAMPMKNVIEDD